MWHLLLSAALAFPPVQARDLDGRTIETSSLRGSEVIFLIGFSYDSRNDVEAWASFLAESKVSTRTIQMPVYSGLAKAARPMIDNAMASHTPKSARHNVMTTTDHDALLKGLRLPVSGQNSVVVLVDSKGDVVQMELGSPSAASKERMLKAIKRLRRS